MLRQPLVLAVLLACTPGTDRAKVDAKVDCAARVAAMRELFAHAPDSPVVVSTPPGFQLPTTSGGASVGDAIPVFVLADGGFEFDSRPFPSVATVHEAIAEAVDKASTLADRTGRPFEPRLMLIADARAPAATIVELVAAEPLGTRFVLLADLAGDTVPLAPPMPAAVREVIDHVPADQRSIKLAELLRPAIGTCTAIGDVFTSIAETSADRRSLVLLDKLPTAVESCRCEGLDLDTIVSIVWEMGGKSAPNKRELPLALTRDPAAELVSSPANATVADLARIAESRGDLPFRLPL